MRYFFKSAFVLDNAYKNAHYFVRVEILYFVPASNLCRSAENLRFTEAMEALESFYKNPTKNVLLILAIERIPLLSLKLKACQRFSVIYLLRRKSDLQEKQRL